MDSHLTVLKLLLDELDIEARVDSLTNRKRIQKAVYLAQAAGVGLNYRFSWYVKGPYSPPLTRDYFALDEALKADGAQFGDRQLHPTLKEQLNRIKQFRTSAPGDLNDADWLELLASVHYLLRERGESPDKARQILSEQKPQLAPFWKQAVEQLHMASLGI